MTARKVMIEDGDSFMRMCTKKLLIDNGFEVAETANGIEASWESHPEIMLLDLAIPDTGSSAGHGGR